jgi:hypothetical protein
MDCPLCYKCADKIIQPDMLDDRCTHVCGCKELTATQWEKGMKKQNGIIQQTNCPLLLKAVEESKGQTLDRLHHAINEIYSEWDEGNITTDEAYERLMKELP